ncbi:MAG: deoxynucleoside kinase [Bacteroidetes bacterium]|nr:deoxynucleoside kinase [Bacteroidota bacterium]
MKYQFITIEGNIGAGKTTLAQLLSRHYKARLILEEFADNPFLPKFYEKPDQYAFPVELFFMAERYKQLKELLQQQDLFQQITISDYLFTKCLLFAKVTLPADEYRLYQRLFDIIHQQLIQPDLLVYLHAPVEKLQENIKKRNRAYEQNISDNYLQQLQDTYTHYLRQQSSRALFVDVSDADFLYNDAHLQSLINALDKTYESGIHYIELS